MSLKKASPVSISVKSEIRIQMKFKVYYELCREELCREEEEESDSDCDIFDDAVVINNTAKSNSRSSKKKQKHQNSGGRSSSLSLAPSSPPPAASLALKPAASQPSSSSPSTAASSSSNPAAALSLPASSSSSLSAASSTSLPAASSLSLPATSDPSLPAASESSLPAASELSPTAALPSEAFPKPSPKAKKSFASKAQNLSQKGDWLSNARKKKNSVRVVGQEKSSSLEGVPPVTRDYWDLSVSRLSLTATPDRVKHHLQAHNIDVREVFVFDSKIKGTKSAKVRVSIEHRDKAKNGNLWPEHTFVQDWFYKPKPSKDAKSKNGESS